MYGATLFLALSGECLIAAWALHLYITKGRFKENGWLYLFGVFMALMTPIVTSII